MKRKGKMHRMIIGFEFHLRSSPCPFSRRPVNQPVALLLHRADETQPGQNSCQRCGFYDIVAPLSFLRSYQPCFIVMFLFLADQIFYRSYAYRQHLRCGLLRHCMQYHNINGRYQFPCVMVISTWYFYVLCKRAYTIH